MSNELTLQAIASLPPVERAAYDKYMAKNNPPLALSTAAQLFELYLNGYSCEDIARMNKNFSLGMIVRAKVEGLWQERLEAHRRELQESVVDRVKQIQLEAVMFSADLLSASHKQHGDRIKRYLQTGDEKELGDLSISSLKQYKEAIDLLLKLTGQERESKVTVKGEQRHIVEVQAGKPLTPQEAAAMLALVEKGSK